MTTIVAALRAVRARARKSARRGYLVGASTGAALFRAATRREAWNSRTISHGTFDVLHRWMRCLPIFALAVAALGCESTYHPEYHPVTVTTVHQAYSQPAVVTDSGTGTPVVVMPPTPPPAVVQTPPVADPDAFFHDPP